MKPSGPNISFKCPPPEGNWNRRKWRSHPFGRFSQERLTRGTVTSTMRWAAHPSGCARCGAGAGCSEIRYQSFPEANPRLGASNGAFVVGCQEFQLEWSSGVGVYGYTLHKWLSRILFEQEHAGIFGTSAASFMQGFSKTPHSITGGPIPETRNPESET